MPAVASTASAAPPAALAGTATHQPGAPDREQFGKPTQGNLVLASAQTTPQDKPAQLEVLPNPEKVEPQNKPQPIAGAEPLSLSQALESSLARNPDLVTLRGQVNVNQAMVGVARTPIWNPFVQSQFFPRGHPFVHTDPFVSASGAGLSNFYVWAMQRFELAHQRQFRTESALAALNQVEWNVFQGELLNVALTVRLYLAALYQKELYDLAAASAELNDRLLQTLESRHRANLSKQGDVITARIAARQASRQRELAETAYQGALAALRIQLNLPSQAPLNLTDRLTDIKWQPVRGSDQDEAGLAAELVEGRPDVMAARVGIQVAEANLRLANAARIPDVSAGTIYETADDGTRYIGMRVQMDIPVWNNGGPLARQRQEQMNQQALTYGQLKIKAALEAQAAISQYDRLLALATKTAPTLGATPPELQEVIRLFEAGQADMLAVIAMQSSLLQERRIYLDELNQLSQAASAVIQATGLPPSRLTSACAGMLLQKGGAGGAASAGQSQSAAGTDCACQTCTTVENGAPK
jgi:outer membrane protein TolC